LGERLDAVEVVASSQIVVGVAETFPDGRRKTSHKPLALMEEHALAGISQ